MAAVVQVRRESASSAAAGGAAKPEPKILFQTYFKSVGPRTYAAQVKEAGNGNHFILLTEGKRDEKTGELRKTKLIAFSEDFGEFFKLVKEVEQFVQRNPVPQEVARKRAAVWKKNGSAQPSRP